MSKHIFDFLICSIFGLGFLGRLGYVMFHPEARLLIIEPPALAFVAVVCGLLAYVALDMAKRERR